ncbi:MAG: DUF455 family protein, partial [Bdellovibrionales bacterium]|nr:DUF455 family protein [Bdellovibrionales bacterium]
KVYWQVPQTPARDISVVKAQEMPVKKGLSSKEGQGQTLHEIANIELQAIDLGLRTLIEFPHADPCFRKQLVDIVLEETFHLKICLEGLEQLNYSWGDWPIHTSLWDSTSPQDDLLNRILIVHRYLEGSGLDASALLLRRLSGVSNSHLVSIVKKIANDEEKHVEFGSVWFHKLCQNGHKDSDKEFSFRLHQLKHRLPKKLGAINVSLRSKTGFTKSEINNLCQLRSDWLS